MSSNFKLQRQLINSFTLSFILSIISVKASSLDIERVNSTVACGPTRPLLVDEPLGLVTSPNFNNFHFYNSNLNCTWRLIAPKEQIIKLRILDFDLAYYCEEAALDIYEGENERGDLIGHFCGYKVPRQILSRGSSLYMTFFTTDKPRNTGFRIYFEHSPTIAYCKRGELQCRHQTKCVTTDLVCDGVDDCGDGTDEERCEVPVDLNLPCGNPQIPPVLGNNRIVGGRDAIPGSWPWQVSLRVRDLEPYSHQCGGSLINRQWVVTAAHCFRTFRDTKQWRVHIGKFRKLLKDDTEEIRYIETIIPHPEYKGFEPWKPSVSWLRQKENDIALVRLNAPVTLNSYVHPVCLPDKDFIVETGTICHVTGWGETGGTGFDLVLKQAAVPVVTNAQCQDWYPYYQIGKDMICAGYSAGGHDSCQGDSGGPLVLKVDGRWQAVGIVSTGGVCAYKEQPGIYTKVATYVEWMNQTVTEDLKMLYL